MGVARRLHPFTVLDQIGLVIWRNVLPVALVVVADRQVAVALISIFTTILVIRAVASWWRFTYSFDGGELRIDQGIFTRKHRTIPVDRIHQVDIVATFRHRLFGLAAVRVHTAATGSGAEARLSALSRGDAERLRHDLLAGGTPAVGPAPAASTDDVLVRLGMGKLALAGVTGAQLAVVFTLLFSVLRRLDDLPRSWFDDLHPERLVDAGPGAVALGLFVVVLVWLGAAAGAGIVVDGGFVLRRGREGTVHLRRGLLLRREASLAFHRVQAVRIEQSLPRRVLGLASVRVQSGGTPSERKKAGGRIVVPILSEEEVQRLLATLLPGADLPSPLVPAPPAARRRAIIRTVWPTLVAAALLTAWRPPLGALAFLVVPVAALAGDMAYRGLGHAAGRGFIVARAGGLLRTTAVVPMAKVQSWSLTSSPFQRRLGLATLHVHVAGGGRAPAVVDADIGRLLEVTALLTNGPAGADEAQVRRRLREREAVTVG